MLQRVFRLVSIAAFVLYLPAHLIAAPVLIDFESLTDGDLVDSLLGPDVTFSNAVALTAGVSLNEIDFPPVSGDNVISGIASPLRIDFAAPVSSVSAYFTYVAPVVMQFFDSSANLLGSVTSLFAINLASFGGTPNELLAGSFAGTAFVTIDGTFTLDDLIYDTTDTPAPIPEPGTIVLVASGLAGLSHRRRRAARRRTFIAS